MLSTTWKMNVNDNLLYTGKCITDDVIMKLRLCASLSLLGVISSMFQFALDVCGSNRMGLRCLRRNSIGNIFSGMIQQFTVVLFIYHYLPRISSVLLNCYQWGSCLPCETPTKEPCRI